MSKSKRKKQPHRDQPTKPAARRKVILALSVALVVAVGFAFVLLLQARSADFQALKGRWLRFAVGFQRV